MNRPPHVLRKTLHVLFAVALATTCVASAGWATTAYTWNIVSGSWTDPASWVPARVTPVNDDILIFDGFVVPIAEVLDVPNEHIGQLGLTNSAQVTFVGASSPTLAFLGGIGPDLSIGPGSRLVLSDVGDPITIQLLFGTTGQVEGTIVSRNANRILPTDVGGLEFLSGSVCHADANHVGNLFGVSGPSGVVVFRAGSTYRNAAGGSSSPFGGTAGVNRVVFQTGSLYRQEAATAPVSGMFANRIYADFDWDTPVDVNVSFAGSLPVTMDDLRVLQGGLGIGGSSVVKVRGDVTVSPGRRLELVSGSGNKLSLEGAAPQSIAAPGATFQAAAGTLVDIVNPTGVDALNDLSLNGNLTLTGGRFRTGSNTLHLASGSVLTPGSQWVEGHLALGVAPGSPVVRAFPIGDATRKAAVTLEFSSVATGGEVVAGTTPGDHPSLGASGLDGAKSVNRRWSLSSGGSLSFALCDATFEFDPADLDGGAHPASLLVGKYDAPTWTRPTVGTRTATSTQAIGISSFSDFVLAEGADAIASAPVPGTCISSATPCVAVPIKWTRFDATPVRAYSVEIELSPNLSLCGAQFAAGGYLVPGEGGTSFFVIPDGPNRWIVDEATLGLPCGATGSGTLFTVFVTSTDPGGTGTVNVLATLARDCDNGSVPAIPGAATTVAIDNVAPSAVALSSVQKKTGNIQPPDGTTDVLVSWTGQEGGSSVAVYRKGFGGYPQYDENGGAVPAPPATPAAALSAGWTLTGVTTSGGADRTGARDYYYYVAFVADGCGNVSAVSNQAGGTLNYHLGDVHDGITSCAGNDLVTTSDISALGFSYGSTIPVNDPLECLDVGPMTDATVDGQPTTDNMADFEDLIIYAINDGTVSAPQMKALPAAAANALRLRVPALPASGEAFVVSIELSGAGDIQGVSTQLDYDRSVVEFLGVEAGALLARQAAPGVVLSARPGNVDVALRGVGAGLRGEGEMARARFRVKSTGDPRIRIAAVDARSGANQPIAIDGETTTVTSSPPAATGLAAARPTPFRERTVLEYALAQPSAIELAIYGVDGRRVASLARGDRAAGVYRITWGGRNDLGRPMPAGMYYARLVTPQGAFKRTVVLLK